MVVVAVGLVAARCGEGGGRGWRPGGGEGGGGEGGGEGGGGAWAERVGTEEVRVARVVVKAAAMAEVGWWRRRQAEGTGGLGGGEGGGGEGRRWRRGRRWRLGHWR